MFRTICASLVAYLAASASVYGQTVPQAPTAVLFANVRIFDGKNGQLSGASNVLVRGNRIEKISADSIPTDRSANTKIVDGGGRTLMPGLIDNHAHMAMSVVPLALALTADSNYTMLRQGKAAGEMLLRGFTSVRDVAGPSFGLKRAIDEDVLPGPRIWPSGAAISQTSGHGDYRSSQDLPRMPGDPAHLTERRGFAALADGVPEVLRRTREQLMLGASHIKIMAGGGVSSSYDPLDVRQFTEDEMRAAVDAADAWNTYVTVHAYTPKALQQAIRAGVKCIEHAQLMDEATAKLMADKGIWLSLQPFLDDEDAVPFSEGSESRKKQLQMVAGTDTAYKLAKQYKIKTAFGTDTLFDAKLASRQGAQLAKLTRWYTPAEVLAMATGTNGELLALSGPRSPYPGKIGVVEEGALADLLLVAGDPIADINLIADPAKNLLVIMKDGKIYKNAVP
jgi:imidazolonepropionase-like amidohydrolase